MHFQFKAGEFRERDLIEEIEKTKLFLVNPQDLLTLVVVSMKPILSFNKKPYILFTWEDKFKKQVKKVETQDSSKKRKLNSEKTKTKAEMVSIIPENMDVIVLSPDAVKELITEINFDSLSNPERLLSEKKLGINDTF